MCWSLTILAIALGSRLQAPEPPSANSEVSWFIVWKLPGPIRGELVLDHARVLAVDPYGGGNLQVDESGQRLVWTSQGGHDGSDGLQLHIVGDHRTTGRLRLGSTPSYEVDIPWTEMTTGEERWVERADAGFIAWGPGDIRRGPRRNRFVAMPAIDRVPAVPDAGVIVVPDDAGDPGSPITIELAAPPPGELAVRRQGRGDGRLYLEVASTAGPLTGTAEVRRAGQRVGLVEFHGTAAATSTLWLALTPRIGRIGLIIDHPGGRQSWAVPTTLVEARGSRLYVNGEPFLVKGTMVRDLADEDGELLKALGANTLRTRGATDLRQAERYAFMLLRPCHPGDNKVSKEARSDTEFGAAVTDYVAESLALAREAVASPYTLVLQLGNEQAYGDDPWHGRLSPPHPFERIDHLLAATYNALRRLDYMLPMGYANFALGYIAPEFLEVYLHNSYLSRDRGWPSLDQFLRLQSCDRRPFIESEFGANVYLPQAYSRGPNPPVLEKIHAWNFPNRWRSAIATGSSGGTNFCFQDLTGGQRFTNFGVMTADHRPKLALWELWHLWRDFELARDGDDAVRLTNRRDYWARDANLTVQFADTGDEVEVEIGDVPPASERRVAVAHKGRGIRWRVDFTTHGGLAMAATGADPPALEAEGFLKRIAERDTYPFLRQLFDAEVVTAGGLPAPATLAEMERTDGVVAVLFRKPNGVTYVTAFSRRPAGLFARYHIVELDVAGAGVPVVVDEMTGEPTGKACDFEAVPGGIRLKGLRVPYLPQRLDQRSRWPISLPVVRISPGG